MKKQFRFWHKKLHHMSKTYGLGVIYESLYAEWGVFDWDDIEKMQYANFEDKNGKEVYEGDILDHPAFSPRIVKWTISGLHNSFNVGKSFKDFEVIGNICENPLLEERTIK